MTPVIEVTGLTKRYGGQAVVDGICFQVERGEIYLGIMAAWALVAATVAARFFRWEQA